jgi:hypothetical protein
MFTDQLTRAIAAARTSKLCLPAIRSRTRRRLHEPRPAATPEIRTRIGQWKAEIKAACLAGYLIKGADMYLHELLAIPSVARGDWCLYSDAQMGGRLNTSDRTTRRRRKCALDCGLVEVLGCGKDHKPCAVRPLLRDGTPVFLGPEMAGKSDTFGRLTRPLLAENLLLTDTLKTEKPPLLPVPEASKEGGSVSDQFEDEPAEPELLAGTIVPPNAEPAAREEPPAMGLSEFWLAMGRVGSEGYARAQWAKLSAADKAAIRDRLGRPRSWAADLWAGKWLECRVWEEAAPATVAVPVQVHIREGTPEWRAWQRHLGRSIPVDNRGGWLFPSKLPPLAPEGAQAEEPLDTACATGPAPGYPRHFRRHGGLPALRGPAAGDGRWESNHEHIHN